MKEFVKSALMGFTLGFFVFVAAVSSPVNEVEVDGVRIVRAPTKVSIPRVLAGWVIYELFKQLRRHL